MQTNTNTTERPALTPRKENRCRTPEAIVSLMERDCPEALPHTRKVGHWLWIAFPQKPEPQTRDALKVLGFSWNVRRGAWQHPCGYFRPKASSYDPRDVYGEEEVTHHAHRVDVDTLARTVANALTA